MVFKTIFSAAFGLASLASAAPLAANPAPQAQVLKAGMVTASNPQSVVNALQAAGYRAKLIKDNVGDPMVESSAEGLNYSLLFYGCTGGKNCTTLTLTANFADKKATLEQVNSWNAMHRFGRAYISSEGAPKLEFDVDLDDGGMSTALFEDNIEYWGVTLNNFSTMLNEAKSGN